jgi:hypothetical protein
MMTDCCCIRIKRLKYMKAEIEGMFCIFASLRLYYHLKSDTRTELVNNYYIKQNCHLLYSSQYDQYFVLHSFFHWTESHIFSTAPSFNFTDIIIIPVFKNFIDCSFIPQFTCGNDVPWNKSKGLCVLLQILLQGQLVILLSLVMQGRYWYCRLGR